MKIVEIDQVKLTTTASILKMRPKELSFMASLGLGFFEAIIKDPKSEHSKASLNHLYQFNQTINELLTDSGYQQYIEYFQYLTINLQKFTSLIEYVKIQENEYMIHTLYYIFSAIYAHIYKIPLFQSHPADLNMFKVYIEYFCSQLGVCLTIYSSIESFITIGSGLSISLFFDNSEYSLILEFDANINSSQTLIEEIFNQVSIPKSLKQFDSIIEIIESYKKHYKKLTPAMENIINIRKTWTCSHDLKTMKFNCGQKHCLYCLFDNIKFCVPEEAKCRCGYLLTPDEYEKIFKSVQPLFQRYFKCSYCKKKFEITNSITCEGHSCCINCRSVSRKNCLICFRPYTLTEIEKFNEIFQGVDKEKIGKIDEKVEVDMNVKVNAKNIEKKVEVDKNLKVNAKNIEKKVEVDKNVKVNAKNIEKKVEVDKNAKANARNIEEKDFICKVCGRNDSVGERQCKSLCGVCRSCWRNLRNCSVCGEKTENIVVVVCSYCKKGKFKQQELVLLKCKHVYHTECLKFDKCKEGNS